ncbi:hypothetical protein [Ralstonia solanacearum]|uniref:hypothetical protein n=1 Tax=Ralstonia solanacearum TaxID=305 RepID=UPI000698E835|nr:hypothetical protein [Ralstonia solanacearum]MDB0544514.1 hypothetical protein [Ralstonia solanacearum]MDB0554313.1 hypothetical protein [Ralstonia solanacearum]MDB0559435.1 hypothetical protein [Ralstonia solanacearum]MDC6177155.1 hypothetical protein [Ralstonia solanacearum]MDC6238312.1 hypothetical protein [Ralstonia solanacearum]
MTNGRTMAVPVELPPNWIAEAGVQGVVIMAYAADGRSQGSVTVCTKVRGFALGISRVYAGECEKRYLGRGWEAKLYADAIAALHAIWA